MEVQAERPDVVDHQVVEPRPVPFLNGLTSALLAPSQARRRALAARRRAVAGPLAGQAWPQLMMAMHRRCRSPPVVEELPVVQAVVVLET